nr:tetratricopeptide repeat protein [Nodosilinea sp. FACHB-13]
MANGECGTGFFVAPGRVLTCEHVVRRAGGAPIAMRWRQIQDFAEAQVEQVWAEIDLALLTFIEPPQNNLPCVYLDDEDVRVGDQLYLFGYPAREFENGRPVTPECEGFTGDEPPFIMLEQGQVQPGMSGAALLNRRTGKVCGMAKFTLDEYSSLGGGGVKTAVIMQRLPVLADWQQAFHQQDGRWQRFLDHLDTLPSPLKVCPNNLPHSGAVEFVGRETDLTNLHIQLHQSDRIAITAVRGMGGIGKTELALRYALQQRDRGIYPGGICWLQAKEQDVGTEIVNYAIDQLGLNMPTDIDLPRQAQFCWRNWPGDGDVLVVIDDVSGPDDNAAYIAIKPYLPPQKSRFRVLLTTRLQLGASIQMVLLDVLSEAASLDLLRSLVRDERVDQEPDIAKALCEWLGYLPLGLELVGRFLARKPGWTLAKMQQQLHAKRLDAKALTQAQADMTAAHESLAAAFELSWQDLELEAQELAYRLCLFALAPIPWEWIENWYEGTDPYEIEDWRDEGLINRSLITVASASGAPVELQLHQLIREFFRSKLELWSGAEALKQGYCQATVQVARQIPDIPTRDQILAVTAAIPHLAEAATTWQHWLDDESLGWPFIGLGRFYQGQGAYGQAEPWLQDCLMVTRDRLGDDHLAVAASMNNLAALYQSQGRYSEAEPFFRDALMLHQRLLDDDHPTVATSMNNLAYLCESQGRYSEAELFFRDALMLRQRFLDDDHPDVATSMNNLAGLYELQGRYSEAEPLLRDALTLRQQRLGDNHPDVASSMNNLAELYRSQGRYSEAEPLFRKALTLLQWRLGDDHPNVASSMNNLANLYRLQERYREAESLFHKALMLCQRRLGDDHPDVAISMNNLAELYRSQGRYGEAEPLATKSLQISISVLGQEHPTVGICLCNLARLRVAQDNFADVEAMLLQALRIFAHTSGAEHPYTIEAINRLGDFVGIVIVAGQIHILSDHPITQDLLRQVQRQ